MKALLLAFSAFTIFSAQAEVLTNLDLTKANNVICGSEAVGSFSLRGLKTKNPSFNRSRIKPIMIEKVSSNSIEFRYKDSPSHRYSVLLTKTIIRQDIDNSRYPAHRGVIINGDIESPIECIVD